MASEVEYTMFSGNDIKLMITVMDTDTNLPLNLSGALALIWTLAKNVRKAALITKNLTSGIVITDAANGMATVTLDAADTEPLKGNFYNEMRLTDSLGKKSTLLYGPVEIVQNLIQS